LPAKKVESLREALAGSISGILLAADDAQARAEARHSIKADLINRLLQGDVITLDDPADDNKEVFVSLIEEPYVRTEGSRINLGLLQE
jgi:hypothetical protein